MQLYVHSEATVCQETKNEDGAKHKGAYSFWTFVHIRAHLKLMSNMYRTNNVFHFNLQTSSSN